MTEWTLDSSGLVLASASPRRRELLAQLGLAFEVIPAQGVVEREEDADLAPSELVEYNARLKAVAVQREHPQRAVLGSDTLVFLDGEPLTKPRDLEEATSHLSRLAGRAHEVITAVCLLAPSGGQMCLFHEVTKVHFRALRAREIADYIDQVEVMDKAGAYALQDGGERIVERIEGSRSNVIGLPLEKLEAKLLELGWVK